MGTMDLVTTQLFSQASERPAGLPRGLLFGVSSAAVGALLMEYGFSPGTSFTFWLHVLEGLLAAIFVADRAVTVVRSPDRWALIRQRRFEYVVLTLFLLLGLGLFCSAAATARAIRFLHESNAQTLSLNLLKLFLLANVVSRAASDYTLMP
jgi:hypothetical protein